METEQCIYFKKRFHFVSLRNSKWINLKTKHFIESIELQEEEMEGQSWQVFGFYKPEVKNMLLYMETKKEKIRKIKKITRIEGKEDEGNEDEGNKTEGNEERSLLQQQHNRRQENKEDESYPTWQNFVFTKKITYYTIMGEPLCNWLYFEKNFQTETVYCGDTKLVINGFIEQVSLLTLFSSLTFKPTKTLVRAGTRTDCVVSASGVVSATMFNKEGYFFKKKIFKKDFFSLPNNTSLNIFPKNLIKSVKFISKKNTLADMNLDRVFFKQVKVFSGQQKNLSFVNLTSCPFYVNKQLKINLLVMFKPTVYESCNIIISDDKKKKEIIHYLSPTQTTIFKCLIADFFSSRHNLTLFNINLAETHSGCTMSLLFKKINAPVVVMNNCDLN